MYRIIYIIKRFFLLKTDPDVRENGNRWVTNRESMVDVIEFRTLISYQLSCNHMSPRRILTNVRRPLLSF
jgi:hypothetical protein